MWAWGKNQYYQLGNTNEDSIKLPSQVEGLENIKKIACGDYNSFAIGSFGEVYGFGLNANGECGVGIYTEKIPVTKAKNISDIIEVKAGENHTVLLRSTGEVYVSGTNGNEELDKADVRKINEFAKIENVNKAVMISAGSIQNVALKQDGTIYSWGLNKNINLSDIRYISGGKEYNLAINKNGEIYGCGQNEKGEFGNATNISTSEYTKIEQINNVLGISAGENYSVLVKQDGTVWGTGDYTQGNDGLKSKTKGNIWIQVGNDSDAIRKTEITLKIGETKNLTQDLKQEFNLIYLEETDKSLSFETKKAEIVAVDNLGNIEGKRVGTTRVIITDNTKNKKYSVLVKVIPEESIVAPKVEAGEKFATVLKSDGTIWAFGNNNSGALGIGDYITKDVPTQMDTSEKFKDIKTGDNHVVALKENKTVWSTKNARLEQIQELTDIEKIACGDNFGMAIDSYGNVYEWEKENINVRKTDKIGESIINISAGKDQRIFITAKGKVIGKGRLLNGEIAEINNAVKAEVLTDKIIILTSNGEILEYVNNQIVQKQTNGYVIDINAKKDQIMYQTAEEKAYEGERENIFGIGAGTNNTYVIENTGRVYAKGDNEYGSLGNGTRDSKEEYTLVGDRNFTVEPITKTMREGDVEEVNIEGNPFNVFKEDTLTADEYTWDSQNIKIQNPAENVVTLDVNDTKGTIHAENEGTAKITITDKVTNKKVELTRIVMMQDKDRIEKITVNGVTAVLDKDSTDEDIKYRVKVITNENTGNLVIDTINKTDIISIDESQKWDDTGIPIPEKWSTNGRLEQAISIPNKETTVKITLGVQNNEGNYPQEISVPYTLIVEKISDDASMKKLTVTSKDELGAEKEIEAQAITDTRYEVCVEEGTDITKILGETTSKYSSISIGGKVYTLNIQSTNENLDTGVKEVKFSVKTEANKEKQYTLVIYKGDSALELESLTVNNKEASKVTETEYTIKVPRNTSKTNIIATLNNSLGQVSIQGNEYKVKTNTNELIMTDEELDVTINAKVEIAGKEHSKEYILKIIKTSNNTELIRVEVDGGEATLGEDGNYHYSLKQGKTKVNVLARTLEEVAEVKIENGEYVLHETIKEIRINKVKTEVKIKVKAEDGTENEHLLIINGLPDDVNIEKVIVNEKSATYNYAKSRYEVRCKENEYNVEVTLADSLASLELGGNAKVQGMDTIKVTKTGKETIVEVTVTSQSELVKQKYQIAILEQSQNSNLDTIDVNGKLAKQKEDGTYYIELPNATTSLNITATAEDTYANTVINANPNNSYIAKLTENVTPENSNYTYNITVTAENGNKSTYELQVKILEANYELLKVLVGETEEDQKMAIKQEDGSYYYKIGKVDEAYVSAIPESAKSKVSINGEETEKVRVDLPDEITEVTIQVTGEDGTTKDVTLIIEKMSSNTEILSVTGEGVIETEIVENIVYVSVDEDLTEVDLDITLKHKLAKLKLADETEYTINTINRNISLAGYKEDIGIIVNVDVEAEDGTQAQYILNIAKRPNLELESVIINNENVEYNDENDKYETKVPNANKPHTVITAKNKQQTVQLLNSSGTVIAQGVGSITTDITLSTSTLTDDFKIKVISHNGEAVGSKTYDLSINQKSAETGIIYVKVDNLGTTVDTANKTYSSSVSGKDKYRSRNKAKR